MLIFFLNNLNNLIPKANICLLGHLQTFSQIIYTSEFTHCSKLLIRLPYPVTGIVPMIIISKN